jgi:glycosyltransferase involved in cell wall biosynthesis
MTFKSVTIDTTGKVSNLCKIGMVFNSDKCPYSKETTSGHRHPYTPIYDELFFHLRDEQINVAEIGIEKNDSINIWRRYFPIAKIYGFEYNDEYLKNARSQNLIDVTYEKIDVCDETSITSTLEKVGVRYDIIVEDSTHVFEDQIRFIKHSINYLKEGGILVIEDIFRSRSEEDYYQELKDFEKYFSDITFITAEHENRYSPGWDNDKLLVLMRNNVSIERSDKKSKVFIVTPSRRPFNAQLIAKSIPQECEWVVVFDKTVKNEHEIENATTIKSTETGFWGNPNRNIGLEYIKNNLDPTDNDWIYILDDDNIIHPNWWGRVSNYLDDEGVAVMTWGQVWATGEPRTEPTNEPKIAKIDTSQYMVRWSVAKNLRFEHIYEADGIYAEEAAKQGKVLMLNEYLGYYNFLRSHKSGSEIRTNICMISMFKNEAKGMRRMLESVWRHIDFYVFQDNGSTDGTPDIVREFFADKNIPGFIYEIEEGWVGFGWNRDHLLQTTLRNDHGCDWIMKMDCDEYLEVDDDFDWSYFYDTNIQSFHVAAQSPGCMYYRAWIWNAKLPWKFKHDVAHECIYLDDGVTGENFQVTDLPRSLRMVGTPDGESYTVRTKYITDALKLEEKLIREETMLTDMYHFWYTGKSYMDCFGGDFYPLGEHHSKEFARRAIFYFEQYIDVLHQRGNLQRGINEMCYYASFSIGECYKFLGDTEKAIFYYKDAESFCPIRNEHIVCLARIYHQLGQYDKMLEQTTRLMQPERKLPFPDYYFLIDTNLYYDSGPVPEQLHNLALQLTSQEPKQLASPANSIEELGVNTNEKPKLWVVDDFYADPYAVREFALKQEFEENLDYYKGNRSKNQFIVPGTKEAFEKIIGKKITNWTETHGMCGRFQYCTAQDDLVYHCDGQTLAGMVYLTPDAPVSCGTSLFAHKRTGLRNENDFGDVDVFGETGFYDRTKFELVDTAGNVFNRLVLFDAKCIHSANEYFGTHITNSRLFHLFFFD